MRNLKIEQNGRSMIEMLGVLAIVGVLSVAGIAGYSKAMNKYKSSKLQDQISMTAANIRTMFASEGSYEALGANPTVAFNLGLLNDDIVKTCNGKVANMDSCMKNAMGGSFGVAYAAKTTTADTTGAGADAYHFVIGVGGLDKEACAAVAGSDWGDMEAVLIGKNAATATAASKDKGSYGIITKQQIAAKSSTLITQVATACGNCTKAKPCTVSIRFK